MRTFEEQDAPPSNISLFSMINEDDTAQHRHEDYRLDQDFIDQLLGDPFLSELDHYSSSQGCSTSNGTSLEDAARQKQRDFYNNSVNTFRMETKHSIVKLLHQNAKNSRAKINVNELHNLLMELADDNEIDNETLLKTISERFRPFANVPKVTVVYKEPCHMNERCSHDMSTIGYAILVRLIYLHYLKKPKFFTHNLHMELTSLPFRRFLLYVSAKRGCRHRRQVINFVCKYLAERFSIKRELVVTIFNVSSAPFFMITTADQYDICTAEFMLEVALKEIGLPDGYEVRNFSFSWLLPLANYTRPYAVYHEERFTKLCEAGDYIPENLEGSSNCCLLTPDMLLKMSPIDVHNATNCLTLATILATTLDSSELVSSRKIVASMIIDCNNFEETNYHVILSPRLAFDKFFQTFYAYHDISLRNGTSYTPDNLFRFFVAINSTDDFRYRDRGDSQNDVKSIELVEFYDIYHSTTIRYEKKLTEIFQRTSADQSKMRSLMSLQKKTLCNDINIVRTSTVKRHMNKFDELANHCSEYIFTERENLIFEMCMNTVREIEEATFRCVASDIIAQMNEKVAGAHSFMVAMYAIYCYKHCQRPQCTFEYINQHFFEMCLIFCPETRFDDFLRHLQNSNFDDGLPPDFDNDSSVVRHILAMMLLNGHVTSVVALILRQPCISENISLQRAITYCLYCLMPNLCTPHIKYILTTTLNVCLEGNEKNLQISMKKCFFTNIMIYFLLDFVYNANLKMKINEIILLMKGQIPGFQQGAPTRPLEEPGDADNEEAEEEEQIDEQSQPEEDVGKKRKKKASGRKNTGVAQVDASVSRSSSKSSSPPPSKKAKKPKLADIVNELCDPLQNILIHFVAFAHRRVYMCMVYNVDSYEDFADNLPFQLETLPTEYPNEPSNFAYWYRRQPGIFNSYTGAFERHSPGFFNTIYLLNPPWVPSSVEFFNNFNYDLKNKMLDITLKAVHFIGVCKMNRLSTCLLSTIHDPDKQLDFDFTYAISNVQILPGDMNYTMGDMPPASLYYNIVNNHPELDHALRWMYLILCRLSNNINMKPYNLVPAKFLANMFIEQKNQMLGIDSYTDEGGKTKERKKKRKKGTTADGASIAAEVDAFEEIDATWSTILTQHRREIDENLMPKNKQEVRARYVELAQNSFNTSETNVNMGTFTEYEESFTGTPPTHVIKSDIWTLIESNGGTKLKAFLLYIVSWFIRMGPHHIFANTMFFRYISANRRVLYNSLHIALKEECGPLLQNTNCSSLAKLLRLYCENSKLSLNEDFSADFPRGYRLNHAPITDLDDDIYLGVADLVNQSQYNAELFVDLFKNIVRFQHRGNIDRLCVGMVNRSATGKSEFMRMLCEQFKTNATQSFTGKDLLTSESSNGSSLAISSNKNLLIAFEELPELQSEFKALVGTNELTTRRLYTAEGKANLRVNSHVMFATNTDPNTSDAAVLARLIIFDRKFQYVGLRNKKIARQNCCAETSIQHITSDLGTQILLQRLPRDAFEGHLGYFLLIFMLGDIFRNKFSSPISLKRSKSLENVMNQFIYNAQPARYILDNNLLEFTYLKPMSLESFDAHAGLLFKQLKGTIKTFNIPNALAELKDQLSNYIEDNLIYVKFN